jgi:FAD/FMN-containing dehydrogenase
LRRKAREGGGGKKVYLRQFISIFLCFILNLNAPRFLQVYFLKKQYFLLPPSVSRHKKEQINLTPPPSCQIGGNISTNAGGVRFMRWGSLRGNVVGLRAVLASGDVVDALGANSKNSTGVDVRGLFVGAEGTLGVVTAASILTPRKPRVRGGGGGS